jgi:hypothetical protein
VVGEGEILVHGLDAHRPRLPRIGNRQRPAVEQQLAGVGLVDAGDDLDQCCLTGAVVSDDGVNLVQAQREVRIPEGNDMPEVLLDVPGLEEGRRAVVYVQEASPMFRKTSLSSATREYPTPSADVSSRRNASRAAGVGFEPTKRLHAQRFRGRRLPVQVRTEAGFTTFATVDLRHEGGHLFVTVEDDGVERNSRLVHLADRIGALGGSLEVGGTMLRAEIPCA